MRGKSARQFGDSFVKLPVSAECPLKDTCQARPAFVENFTPASWVGQTVSIQQTENLLVGLHLAA